MTRVRAAGPRCRRAAAGASGRSAAAALPGVTDHGERHGERGALERQVGGPVRTGDGSRAVADGDDTHRGDGRLGVAAGGGACAPEVLGVPGGSGGQGRTDALVHGAERARRAGLDGYQRDALDGPRVRGVGDQGRDQGPGASFVAREDDAEGGRPALGVADGMAGGQRQRTGLRGVGPVRPAQAPVRPVVVHAVGEYGRLRGGVRGRGCLGRGDGCRVPGARCRVPGAGCRADHLGGEPAQSGGAERGPVGDHDQFGHTVGVGQQHPAHRRVPVGDEGPGELPRTPPLRVGRVGPARHRLRPRRRGFPEDAGRRAGGHQLRGPRGEPGRQRVPCVRPHGTGDPCAQRVAHRAGCFPAALPDPVPGGDDGAPGGTETCDGVLFRDRHDWFP